MTKAQGPAGDAPAEEDASEELAQRRARLLESLKEGARFRQLLREAAAQLRADAAKLSGEDEAPRRRLLTESASRMDRYAADMEEENGVAPGHVPPAPKEG
jgi:hypothetical protein